MTERRKKPKRRMDLLQSVIYLLYNWLLYKYRFCISVIGYIKVQIIGIGYKISISVDHCSRQCRNNLHIDSTYLQTYTEDNVQNTHTYSQYTQCTIRHTYSYQYTLYTVCTHSTLCTHTHNNIWRCNRLCIIQTCNVMVVHWMVSSGNR